MKQQLQTFSHLQILKRNTKLHPDCYYLLSSESTAHSLYFETERDIRFAHRQIKRHLGGVLDVLDYLFTPHGWLLSVVIKSKDKIIDFYKDKKNLSDTIQSAIQCRKISTILSECIRYAISSIARYVNYKLRRKGTIVRENFSRYIFDKVEGALEVMKSMKRYEINLCNQHFRYKPKMKLWKDTQDLLGMDNVFLTTRRMVEALEKGEKVYEVISLRSIKKHVLRKNINQSKILHLPHILHTNQENTLQ